jgi:hypothetical protein
MQSHIQSWSPEDVTHVAKHVVPDTKLLLLEILLSWHEDWQHVYKHPNTTGPTNFHILQITSVLKLHITYEVFKLAMIHFFWLMTSISLKRAVTTFVILTHFAHTVSCCIKQWCSIKIADHWILHAAGYRRWQATVPSGHLGNPPVTSPGSLCIGASRLSNAFLIYSRKRAPCSDSLRQPVPQLPLLHANANCVVSFTSVLSSTGIETNEN